ncbi:MAG: hypothetical protein AAF565_19235 [Pseudomonadota bacterium]
MNIHELSDYQAHMRRAHALRAQEVRRLGRALRRGVAHALHRLADAVQPAERRVA